MSAPSRESASVARVRDALSRAGFADSLRELDRSARTAQDAAAALGCPLGAIVKSLVFRLGERPVMALVAGDRHCVTSALPEAFDMPGKISRANAETVREATGFAIGGVAPVGHICALPMVIDDSLTRFSVVYAAAGHPHWVFATTVDDLKKLTGADLKAGISKEPTK